MPVKRWLMLNAPDEPWPLTEHAAIVLGLPLAAVTPTAWSPTAPKGGGWTRPRAWRSGGGRGRADASSYEEG